MRANQTHWQMALATLAVFLVFAGCSSQAPEERGRAPEVEPAGAAGGFPIVAYSGEDLLGGREVDFEALLGQGKPVVLNFWAGLCPPCRAEMPAFQRVHEEHRDAVLFVGVDVGGFTGLGSRAEAQRLLRELKITYPTGYAANSQALADYRVVTMPTTVFFGRDGREVRRHGGLLTEDDLRAQVEALVASR